MRHAMRYAMRHAGARMAGLAVWIALGVLAPITPAQAQVESAPVSSEASTEDFADDGDVRIDFDSPDRCTGLLGGPIDGADALAKLTAILADDAQSRQWSLAVECLGLVRTGSSGVLVDFLLDKPDGKLTAEEYIAKAAVPVSLGWIVKQSSDPRSLDVLLRCSDGSWWKAQGIAWENPYYAGNELTEKLVGRCLQGGAVSGSDAFGCRFDYLAQLAKKDGRTEPDCSVYDLPQAFVAGTDGFGIFVKFDDSTHAAVVGDDGSIFPLEEYRKTWERSRNCKSLADVLEGTCN